MIALDVRWNVAAECDLLALPPSQAERILDAVENFARTGRGFVRVLLDGSGERRLHVGELYAVFDVDASTIMVLRVHRRRDALTRSVALRRARRNVIAK